MVSYCRQGVTYPHSAEIEHHYGHMSRWDTSKVTNMGRFFQLNHYDQDISKWDVSLATHMNKMFFDALCTWMFYYPENFNDDISRWNVAKVTTMEKCSAALRTSTAISPVGHREGEGNELYVRQRQELQR